MKSCFEMKHATATSKTERKREREGNKKEENFYYKRISHTHTHTPIHTTLSRAGSKEGNRGKEAHEKMKLKRQTTKKVGNLMRKATKTSLLCEWCEVCVCVRGVFVCASAVLYCQVFLPLLLLLLPLYVFKF